MPLLETADRIIRAVETVQPPKDGHLGVLRTIRKYFDFLKTDYGFSIVDEQAIGVRFSSGKVHLELEYARDRSLSCSFGQESDPKTLFWIDDLLFMYGDQRYRTLPQELTLDAVRDVESWFSFLGSVFKQYGHDILSNRPGIFQELARAQAERGEQYTRKWIGCTGLAARSHEGGRVVRHYGG